MVELRVSSMKLKASKYRALNLIVETLSLNDVSPSFNGEVQSLNEEAPHLKISSSEPQ